MMRQSMSILRIAAVIALLAAVTPPASAQDAGAVVAPDEQTRAYQRIAEQLIEEGRYHEAAQLLQRAAVHAQLQRDKREMLSRWHAQEGQGALKDGHALEARAHAQQALKLDAGNRAATQLLTMASRILDGGQRKTATKLQLMARARLAERSGDSKKALNYWRQAQALDAKDPTPLDAIKLLQARLNPQAPKVRQAAEMNLIPYKPFSEEYTISRGDVIEVFVWQQPDLTRDVVVRPDGRISFPLVGDVDAAGMTLMQLDQVITHRLKTYVKIPDVSLAIRRFGGTKTIVLGEVATPGIYIPTEEGRVLDVIAMAGGFMDHAVRDNVMLIRGDRRQPQVAKLNLSKALALGVMEENVRLQPNDIVFVPKKRINTLLEFMDDFYPVIDEVLVGQSVATGFGADPRIRKSDRPRN